MENTSFSLDPRYVDFDRFADQLASMLDEADIPLLGKEIPSPIPKPWVNERFFIELYTLREFLVKKQFTAVEGVAFWTDFQRLPARDSGSRIKQVNAGWPYTDGTRFDDELVLFFILLRYKLKECYLEKETWEILPRLFDHVTRNQEQPLPVLLKQLYIKAERLAHEFGSNRVRIIRNFEAYAYELSRPWMQDLKPGKTHSCKCGWKGFIPVFVHATGHSCQGIVRFCTACKKRIGW